MKKTCLSLIMTGLLALTAFAAPQTGQVVRDPDHPGRLVYHETYLPGGRLKPCFPVGPGDPEDFFYNNTSGNLSLLKARGARCTYITAYLGDFGGGNPGTGAALDATLNTWETYMTELENAGIITVFFFFDDSRSLVSDWQTAVDKIVNKFEHHKLLVWSVAEEYSEALSVSQVAQVAARIKAADDYDHVVGVHQLSGTSFDFNGYADLEMFLIQWNQSNVSTIHSGTVAAWNNVGGNKVVNMSEIANHAAQDRTTCRRWNWAAAMGGASMVQILGMGRATDPAANNQQEKYDDCAVLMDFMEQTDVNVMVPHDDLAAGGTQWLLAAPGLSYIAYATALSGNIGVKSMTAGNYTCTWLDIAANTTQTTQATAAAGDNAFTPPSGWSGREVAVWITNGSGGGTPELAAVVVSPPADTILINGSAAFSAQAKDQYGANFSETINWSAGGGGTVTGGTFQSNGTAGTFQVYAAAASDPSIRDTATVVVLASYPAPVAHDATLDVPKDGSAGISLPFSSSSSGPFTFTITVQAAHGNATNSGNDATYAAQAGYTGPDTFKWTVTDQSNGKVSNVAVVAVTVAEIRALEITNTNVASGKTYVWDTLEVGDSVYIDRAYTYTSVPAAYTGELYLRTANDDKAATGSPFISFTVNQESTVYVCYAGASPPAWLSTWTNTGDAVQNSDRSMTVYSKVFAQGAVQLGDNGGAASMYSVVVVPTAGSGSTDRVVGLKGVDQVITVSPNPFHSSVNINYELQIMNYELKDIRLAIYNINGKRIADIKPKIHNSSFIICNSFSWNASGSPAGVYIARITTGRQTFCKKLVLTR